MNASFLRAAQSATRIHEDSGSSGDNEISDKLSNNTQLAGRLQSLIPPRTNLQTSGQGLKNLGQFAAAVHVSHDLGIPFDQLNSQMIGPPKEILGKAIHSLKPDAKSRTEVETAKKTSQAGHQRHQIVLMA